MEDKTNYNGDYSSIDSDNISSSMPDIAGSSYSTDILSSVSESSDNISSYNYGYSSVSSEPAEVEGLDTDSVLASDVNADSMTDSSFGTDSLVRSEDIYKADTSVYNSVYNETKTSDDSVKNNSSEATYDPTHTVYSSNTAGNTYQGNTTSTYSYGNSENSYSYGGGSSSNTPKNNGSSGLGIVSLVFGILSLVCCCSGCVGSLLSVVAIICGIIQLVKKSGSKGFGIAGIITGALGLILSIVMFIVMIVSYDDIENDFYYDDYDYDYNEDYDYDFNYDSDYDSDYDYDSNYDEEYNYSEYIYGQWLIESGSGTTVYILNEDGSWGWYKDYNDLSNNYYAGSRMEVLSGQDAFDYYGMEDSEAERLDTDIERFFCFKLYVDTYISGGEDKSSQYGAEDFFSIALYMDEYDADSAILINMDSADQYNVVRMGEVVSGSDDGELNYVKYDLYDGQASICVPDSWIYYGMNTADSSNYEVFVSSSEAFEMYVAIQDASGYFTDSQDMIDFSKSDMDDLFGSENIYTSQVLESGNKTVIYYEAYNDSNDLHYYCSYDIYDGTYYTTIEFYVDEDTMNAGHDVYTEYMEDIYESFVIYY